MSAKAVKAHELRSLSKAELESKLVDLKKELGALAVQKVAVGASAKLTRIHDLRKSIARVLTVINLNQREQLRGVYKNKKYLPLDLRTKKTRAMRRRLTKAEASKITEKAKKKAANFPLRKYAVRA
jgi:large subunit ribosomal protein L35e